MLFYVFTVGFLQFALSLGAKLVDLGGHALRILGVVIVRELFLREGTSLGSCLKPSEEKGVRAVIEEFVLGLAGILVHGFPDDGKINERVLKILVILIVPVREHQQFDQLDEDKHSLLAECVKQSRELMLDKLD